MNANIATQTENARLGVVVKMLEEKNHALFNLTLELEDQLKERDDLLKEISRNYDLGFSVYAAVQRYDDLINPKPKWYDNIPDRGVLCWCGDEDGAEGNHIHVVVTYSRGFFTTTRGIPWKVAVPLTNEEIQEFMA